MPPSSEKIKYSQLTSSIKSFVKEGEYDVILGVMTLTNGVLLQLFSHRFNKELSVVITETPQNAEMRILQEAQAVMHAQ